VEAPTGRGLGSVSPPQPTRWSGGASQAPPAGSGAEPQPLANCTHFVSHLMGCGVLAEQMKRKDYEFKNTFYNQNVEVKQFVRQYERNVQSANFNKTHQTNIKNSDPRLLML